jgi:hypothetical protein
MQRAASEFLFYIEDNTEGRERRHRHVPNLRRHHLPGPPKIAPLIGIGLNPFSIDIQIASPYTPGTKMMAYS